MKKLILIFVCVLITYSGHGKSIAICVPEKLDDYTVPNAVYKELKNSRYFNLFKEYVYLDKIDESLYDYGIVFYINKSKEEYYGVVELFKFKLVEGKYEYLFRKCYSLVYDFDRKDALITDIKNEIIDWIDEGLTDK